jgi:HEAT repeat protein
MSFFGPPNPANLAAKADIKGLIQTLGYRRSRSVQEAAARALIQIGSSALDPLRAASRDQKWPGYLLALRTLGQIQDPRVIEILIADLNDPNENLRQAAIEALVQIGAPAVNDLVCVLGAEEKGIRFAAAIALGQIGAPALEALLSVLSEEKAPIRQAAAMSFRGLRDPAVFARLLVALTSSVWAVRRSAAEGLLALYRSGNLDESQKDQVLAWRVIILEAHQVPERLFPSDQRWAALPATTQARAWEYPLLSPTK